MANNYTLNLYQGIIQNLETAQYRAALKTANSVLVDVSAAEVTPFDNGILENSGTVTQTQEGAQIQYSTPYAARQYFDVSLNHGQGPHAGTAKARWLDDYLDGNAKQDFAREKFKKHYASELRRIF